MIKSIFIFFLLLLSFFSFSQGKDNKQVNVDTTTYSVVDTPATFPGGRVAWIKYVQKNLHPGIGVENGARKGRYDVLIKFVIAKDGSLSNFIAETKYGFGMEAEVIRILKFSPKWIPAKRNGINVNSYAEQGQSFLIDER